MELIDAKIKLLRSEFPFIANNPHLIYLDNAGTTLKPNVVLNAISNFYSNYALNSHNNSSRLSFDVDEQTIIIRKKLAQFINAPDFNDVIFTVGTTFGINYLAFGLKTKLQPRDNIVLTKMEHSSNLAPWIRLANEQKAELRYLSSQTAITIADVQAKIDINTKILAIAYVHNSTGIAEPLIAIVKAARKINPKIIIVCDAAQAVVFHHIDVQAFDIDFLVLGAHKMFGPLGIGLLWGRSQILRTLKPMLVGGGEIRGFETNQDGSEKILYMSSFHKHEAGTMNTAAIFGWGAALNFIERIGGVNFIYQYVASLKKYFLEQANKYLKTKITILNPQLEMSASVILFYVNGVFSQDVALYLAENYNIIIRAGDFCARKINQVYNHNHFLRISFNIYNTKTEIDILIKALAETDVFLEKFTDEKQN